MILHESTYPDLFRHLDLTAGFRTALAAELAVVPAVPDQTGLAGMAVLGQCPEPALTQFKTLCTDLAGHYGDQALDELRWAVCAQPGEAGFEVVSGEGSYVCPHRLGPSGTWAFRPHPTPGTEEKQPSAGWSKRRYEETVRAVLTAAVAEIEESGPLTGDEHALIAKEAAAGVPKDGRGWTDAAFTVLQDELVCNHDTRNLYVPDPAVVADTVRAVESLNATLRIHISSLKKSLDMMGKK
ncbi:hypothetical protein [Streptomyces sp. NPDC089919]|uniref:hypothetical protein n=1 Tax=Streptomyces sp. NPDC089919 TaxID=3155188 RepID=UPI0034436C7B